LPYAVILAPAAQRQLGRLRGARLLALRGVIRSLAAQPRPRGARKLAGPDDLWRIRVRVDQEQWRIVYRAKRRDGQVVVLRVVQRGETTYRRLP
jgi:mRNA interferase RelE/StbE